MTYIGADPLYFREYKAKVEIKDKADSSVLYTSDPFGGDAGTTNKMIWLHVARDMQGFHPFEMQIEDEGYALESSQIKTPAHVRIQIAKKSADLQNYLHGTVRAEGYHAGYKGKVLYYISGFAWDIRFIERIVDFDKISPNLLDDGFTVDVTDKNYWADHHIGDLFDNKNEYPPDIEVGQLEGTLGFGYFNETSLLSRSYMETFIEDIVVRFGTMQDVIDIVEDTTGGKLFVNYDKTVDFLSMFDVPYGNKGFVIKDTIDRDNDQAETTMEMTGGDFNMIRGFSKDFGNANLIYGMLSADETPPQDSNFSSNIDNKDFEVAVLFRPPTNPNYRLYVGVKIEDGTDLDGHAKRSRWRICDVDPNDPKRIKDVGGIINNFYVYDQGYNFDEGPTVVVPVAIDRGGLDSRKRYWLIMSSVNALPADNPATIGWWSWAHNGGNANFRAVATPGTSTATDGGSGWTYNASAPKQEIYCVRGKTQAQAIFDDKSARANIMIDDQISLPSVVGSRIGSLRYLFGLIKLKAKKRHNLTFTVRPPNKVPFENDLVSIRHSQLHYQDPGTRAVWGRIQNIDMEFGARDGAGDSPSAVGCKTLGLTVLRYPLKYG